MNENQTVINIFTKQNGKLVKTFGSIVKCRREHKGNVYGRHFRIRLVVDDPLKGKEALEEKGFLVKLTEIIGVEMNDTPGGLTDVLKVIKDNEIDLEYLYAFTHEKVGKAILLLHADNIDELIVALEKNNVVIVPSDEVYNL